jgi:hypothetical protein
MTAYSLMHGSCSRVLRHHTTETYIEKTRELLKRIRKLKVLYRSCSFAGVPAFTPPPPA